jgi:hypothetical protein
MPNNSERLKEQRRRLEAQRRELMKQLSDHPRNSAKARQIRSRIAAIDEKIKRIDMLIGIDAGESGHGARVRAALSRKRAARS